MNNLEELNEKRFLSFVGVDIPNINFGTEKLEEKLFKIMREEPDNKKKYGKLIMQFGTKRLENLTKEELYDFFKKIKKIVIELSLSKPKQKETLKMAKLIKKAVLSICGD